MSMELSKRMAFIASVLLSVFLMSSCTGKTLPSAAVTNVPETAVAPTTVSTVSASSVPEITPSPTPFGSPTASPSSIQIPTPSPTAVEPKPFLPINLFTVADAQSVYYVKDKSNVYKRDIASGEETKLKSYDNPIQQIFLDYDDNLYYLVYSFESEQGSLYKYSGGKAVRLLSGIQQVCGINDKFIYYIKKSSYQNDDGNSFDQLFRFDLMSKKNTRLVTTQDDPSACMSYFSCGKYIYYGWSCIEYSYDAENGAQKKLPAMLLPEKPDPDYLYVISSDKNHNKTILMYNLATQEIVQKTLPEEVSDYSAYHFYYDKNFLYLITEFDNQRNESLIWKIDLKSGEVVNKSEFDATVWSAVSYNGKWYIYSDVIGEGGSTSEKQLSTYDFKTSEIACVQAFSEYWDSGADSDDIASYLDISGGYIWGCSDNSEDSSYILLFSVKIPD